MRSLFSRISSFFFLIIVTAVTSDVSIFWRESGNNNILLPINIVVWVLLILHLRNVYLKNKSSFFETHSQNVWLNLFITIVMLIAITNLPEDLFPTVSDNQKILEANYLIKPWTTNLSTDIFGPIIEELLMRGVFFSYFFNEKNKFSIVLGIITSSFIFAFLHEARLSIEFLPYFIAGILLCITYWITKEIKYPIMVHIGNNILDTIYRYIL